MADNKGAKPSKPAAGAKGAAAKSGGKAGANKLYSVSGGKLQRNNITCPKCGAGVYMAKHKDRVSCGTCHYTEFTSKKH